jgi:hypothetical protein
MASSKAEIDISQFQANLQKIQNFSNPILITAMEMSQNLVRDHAQANHKKAPPPQMGHPDDRYYDRTARLTNSIRAEKVKIERDIITGNVLAGTPGLVEYAAAVELGTSWSRAYPFLGPALSENEKNILLFFDAAIKRVISG